MRTRSDLVAGTAIFVISWTIFLFSHVHQIADSRYSMLVSESLIHHRSFALDTYTFPDLNSSPTSPGYGGIYQLELKRGHVYYYPPVGSSVLSLPYVALMNAAGISVANADGTFSLRGETVIEASLAALLMATFASLVFFLSRILLPLGWSVLVAFSCAFGTQVWSTASRGLWSDTWAILLLGFVVWMLVAQEVQGQRVRPIALASLLAWAYFVRPTNSVSILGVTGYVVAFHRPIFVRYAAAGIAWFGGFVAYSWRHFGQLLPDYYQASRLTFQSFWTALAANLVSPSRGLFVFVPVIVFVIYLLIRYARELTSLRLLILSVGIVAGHLIVVSGYSQWWAGHCYGPRFTTGLVPWFALLSILAIKGRLTRQAKLAAKNFSLGSRKELILGGVLLICSVTINMRGATSSRTSLWNLLPVNIDQQPERVWDWRNPQFLAR